MLFTNKPIYFLPDIYFENDTLKWIDSIKYLGVLIDSKLNFNLHLNLVRSRISRGTGIIYRLQSYFPRSLLMKLYYSLIYSYLTQNIVIWGGVSDNKLRPIQTQMNLALRHILKVKFNQFHRPLTPTNIMYKELGLLKLRDVYEFFIIKFVHSCIYGDNNRIFDEYISHLLPDHSYQTRGHKLNYPQIRLELEKSNTLYNMIAIFNNAPSHLLQPQSNYTLKKNFKVHALNKY